MEKKLEKVIIPAMTTATWVKPLKDYKELPGGAIRINDVHSSLTAIPIDNRSEEFILIDSGENHDGQNIIRLFDRLNSNIKKTIAVFYTHGHKDHLGGADFIASETNSDAFISEIDSKVQAGESYSQGPLPRIFDVVTHKHNAAALLVKPEIIKDDQMIKIGNLLVRAIAMPGHTDGSMGYVVSNTEQGTNLFLPGDALDFSLNGYARNAFRLVTHDNKRSRLSIIEATSRIDDMGIRIDRVIPSHSGDGGFDLLRKFK